MRWRVRTRGALQFKDRYRLQGMGAHLLLKGPFWVFLNLL